MSSLDLKGIPLIGQVKTFKTSVGAGGVIINDQQVLLVKSKDSDLWKFPGGHLHENESVKECVIREVLEETGLIVELTGSPFVSEFDINSTLHLILFYYRAYVVGEGIPEDSDEILETKWFDLASIPDNCYENVKPVIDHLRDTIS